MKLQYLIIHNNNKIGENKATNISILRKISPKKIIHDSKPPGVKTFSVLHYKRFLHKYKQMGVVSDIIVKLKIKCENG